MLKLSAPNSWSIVEKPHEVFCYHMMSGPVPVVVMSPGLSIVQPESLVLL